jgi:DNA helicase HerA-like ATPase
VGIYFVTQNPMDLPESVLGQLGNRVQHALRAFTPKDQKAVRTAAQTFRANPQLDVEKVITELGVGEALVSFLDEHGAPGIVQRAFVCPPQSQIGPVATEQRQQCIQQSVLYGHYENAVDRESAYEILKSRAMQQAQAAAAASAVARPAPQAPSAPSTWLPSPSPRGGRQRQSTGEAMLKSVARAAGSQLGRQLIRGVLGSLLGGKGR